MAQATVELRNLLKGNFELFDFDYPFDDRAFAKRLEQAVIDYYYYYEIGSPTPDQFKHRFKSRWLRMIGYYNQLHNTTLLKYDILKNYSLTEAMEQLSNLKNTQNTTGTNNTKSNTNSTGTSNTQSNSNTKGSDYPQQPIAGGNFLSEETITTVDSNVNDNSNITGSSETTDITNVTGSTTQEQLYQKTIEGLTGTTYPELIQKHRDSLIRITGMVIEELKPCFILVH